MKRLVLTALAAALLSGTALAAPQGFGSDAQGSAVPQGFNNQAPNTVEGVLKNAYDDQVVTLTGRLTNFLGEDRYEFTDEAGQRIEVELDDDRNWGHISRDQLITIVGEVDKDMLSTTIEVKQATVVQQ